eukprot:TRINITY_DN40255_c0_g1_i1.p1 TRINITY_DN40255_c0_g1~~TRINITY_DN40255_c0_g1_i1.p1  ORF type:complete len:394 (-),score=41.09 TRINITY_DN40255_c0_g1_i1:152-1333(-)
MTSISELAECDVIATAPKDPAEWLAQTVEQPLYTDEISIVDPHHHLFPMAMPSFLLENPSWKNTMFGTGGRTALYRPYMVQELVADMAYNNVTHTIHVECGQFYNREEGTPKHLQCVGETKRLQEIADAAVLFGAGFPSVNAGIIAHADLDIGEDLIAEQLDAHISAGKNVCGVRGQVAFAPKYQQDIPEGGKAVADSGVHNATSDPEKLRDPEFRKGLAILQSRDLVFDCFLYHPQLNQLAEVADLFPNLTIVCEHAALPIGISSYASTRKGPFPDVKNVWRAGIQDLAKRKNVYIKLGALTFPAAGFGFDNRVKPIGSEELAHVLGEWYGFIIDAFGAQRCMFESNFPMDKSSCSYTVLWNAFKRIAKKQCTPQEIQFLFGDTAKQVYGLK